MSIERIVFMSVDLVISEICRTNVICDPSKTHSAQLHVLVRTAAMERAAFLGHRSDFLQQVLLLVVRCRHRCSCKPTRQKRAWRAGVQTPRDRGTRTPAPPARAVKCSVAKMRHFTEIPCLWPSSVYRYEEKAQFTWFQHPLYPALPPARAPLRRGRGVFQRPLARCRVGYSQLLCVRGKHIEVLGWITLNMEYY